jgi:adenylosuccinate synthase
VDVADTAPFRARARAAHDAGNRMLERLYDAPPVPDAEFERFVAAASEIVLLHGDVGECARSALDAGQRVLLEGAQGTLLDLDHGTYPFVTSSNTTAAAAAVSLGIPPWAIGNVVGVYKAYATRVGAGPFPTEIAGEEAERLVTAGSEFGATTGRRRRVGWFDAVAARFAARVNGATGIALTKLDVLDAWDRILVCVAYEFRGRRSDRFSGDATLAECRPIYEEWPGWREPTRGARRIDDLPPRARAYVERLVDLVGASLEILSVGSGREETFRTAQPRAMT